MKSFKLSSLSLILFVIRFETFAQIRPFVVHCKEPFRGIAYQCKLTFFSLYSFDTKSVKYWIARTNSSQGKSKKREKKWCVLWWYRLGRTSTTSWCDSWADNSRLQGPLMRLGISVPYWLFIEFLLVKGNLQLYLWSQC